MKEKTKKLGKELLNVASEVAPVATSNQPTNFAGKEPAEIVQALKNDSRYVEHPMIRMLNVTLRELNEDSLKLSKLTLVLSRSLPCYHNTIVDGVASHVLGSTRNVYIAAFQLVAVLKQEGESMLAQAIANNPKLTLPLLEGARVTIFTREYMAGEQEEAPFSDSDYIFEADIVKYYITSIKLGAVGNAVKAAYINRLADNIAASMLD